MPKIELELPGRPRTETVPIADNYRITVARGDGEACTDMEAYTAMTMFCMEFISGHAKKGRKPRKKAASKEDRSATAALIQGVKEASRQGQQGWDS